MKKETVLHVVVWLLSIGSSPTASKTRHQRHNGQNLRTDQAKSGSSGDFLVSYVNATVFLGCHIAEPEIIWLLDGRDVEEYVDYRVKEEVALTPADFDTNGILLGDEGSNRTPRGRKLVGQRLISEYLPKSERHVLAIHSVKIRDSGTWTCIPVPSSNSSEESAGAHASSNGPRQHNGKDSWALVVLDSLQEPHILNSQGKKFPPHEAAASATSSSRRSRNAVITVQEEGEVTLLCSILVKESPGSTKSRLRWTSSHFDTSSQSPRQYFVQNDDQLTALVTVLKLTRVDREVNAKTLRCSLEDEKKNAAVITVLVQYPPTFTIRRTPGFGIPILEGMTVSLDCDADVQPKMYGEWLKDEDPAPSSNGTIIIDAASSADVGWYQCYINYNGEEYSSIGYYLNVKEREEATELSDSSSRVMSSHSSDLGAGDDSQIGGGGHEEGALAEASYASLKTSSFSAGEAQNTIDVLADSVVFSDNKNCSAVFDKQMSEERYPRPVIHAKNASVLHVIVGEEDGVVRLAFEICANPKPSRVFWATPVFTLRPGQVSKDSNLVARNLSRSRTNVTCHLAVLEVNSVTRDLLGEYVLVAQNQYGVEDGVILVQEPRSVRSSCSRLWRCSTLVVILCAMVIHHSKRESHLP